MGTNYYAVKGPCTCCGNETRLHMGKSSGGWRFSLRVYPDKKIANIADWKQYLTGKDWYIVDEYGSVIPKTRFWEIVTRRSGSVGKGPPPFKNILTRDESQRYKSWDEFAAANHAEVDAVHGLLRHRFDEFHCVGHGVGPYDYMIGDFS